MATLGETAPEFVAIPEHLRGRVFLTYSEFGGITGKSAATIRYWVRSGARMNCFLAFFALSGAAALRGRLSGSNAQGFFQRGFQQPRVIKPFRFGGGFEPMWDGHGRFFPPVVYFVFNNIGVNRYRHYHIARARLRDFIGALGQFSAVFFHAVDMQGKCLFRHLQGMVKSIAAGNAARNVREVNADSGVSY